METKCGVDFEKRLFKKSPYDRFDYIRRYFVLELKKTAKDTKHLELSSIRKAIGITAKKLKDVQAGLVDYEIYNLLANLLGESVDVFLSGHESRIVNKDSRATPKTMEEIEKQSKKILAKSSKSKLGVTIEFINHHPEHLGLIIDGNKIHIHENGHSSAKANVVLLGRTEVYIKGKQLERVFPQKVNI